MESTAFVTEYLFFQCIMLVIYFLILRRTTFFTLNRFYLLLALLLPLAIPLADVSTPLPDLPQVTLPVFDIATPTPALDAINWSEILLYSYVLVTTILLIRFARRLFHLFRLRSKATYQEALQCRILKTGESTCYSFMDTIVLPEDRTEEETSILITHELEHIRKHHFLDLCLVHLLHGLLWINPLIFLIRKELSLLHEYQADQGTGGANPQAYLKQLLAFNFGVKAGSLESNFSSITNLKNRTLMLTRKKTPGGMKLMYPLSACLLMIAAFTFSCTKESPGTATEAATLAQPDQMPEFKGGDDALFAALGNNLVYPESAKEAGIEGIVHVKFVVDEEGAVTSATVLKAIHPELDKAALETVSNLPDWNPAQKDGKPVKAELILPISFKLK